MASALQRGKLARAARALNARSGCGHLPPLIFMTDQARASDAAAAARLLPRGSAVIVRQSDARARALMAHALADIARKRGLVLLVAGDLTLATDIRAQGLHLPEARVREAAHVRAIRPSWLITVAAHSARGLAAARIAAVDAALLAPVFATSSHPGREPLGAIKARAMAARAGLPVYALGGVNAQTIGRLEGARLAGIAAIEGLLAG